MITVGLDMGTSTISGVVYDGASGEVLTTLTLPNTSSIKTKHPWKNLQNADVILEISIGLLEEFKKEYPSIGAIGLAGQMHGTAYVDARGCAVSEIATWQDGRGDLPHKDGKTYAQYLSDQCGYPVSTGFGLTTHFYNLQHDRVPKDAASMCIAEDYLGMRLTGREKPLVHASNAHSMGAFDLASMDFDRDAVGSAGIDPAILPDVAAGEAFIGETMDGIPVCVALGDNQASFIGAVGKDSNALANIGTASQISVRSKECVEAEGLDARPFVNGEFLLVGAGLCGGSAYALMRDLFAELLGLYGIETGDAIYTKMEEAAREVIESEHPLEMDIRFRGARTAPEIRGAITNIGMDNFTVGHLALGAMRGICEELYRFYLQVPEALRGTGILTGSGNALRYNATFRELLSERFGLKVRMTPYPEAGAMGAAMLASRLLEN